MFTEKQEMDSLKYNKIQLSGLQSKTQFKDEEIPR